MFKYSVTLVLYFAILLDQTMGVAYSDNIDEDARLEGTRLIIKYGYPLESHAVTTSDGYKLTMHRIPHGKSNGNVSNKKVAFLMHGLRSSSIGWILNGPGSGLAYLLADEGYDVWMGNARGNFYSRDHVLLSPDLPAFWQFSWHEIGTYDLPAMIDYVISTTGQPKIQCICHSQGTTAIFVLLSFRPEYNEKLITVQALAPVAFMGHAESPLLRILAPFVNLIDLLTELLGVNEFSPRSELMEIVAGALCRPESPVVAVCTNLLFLMNGYDVEQLNTTMLPVYLGHFPHGASTNQIIHYIQEANSGFFRQFDFLGGNFARYGAAIPPSYPIGLITAPVYLHYGDKDLLAAVVDVQQLHEGLGNSAGLYRVPIDQWNHLDFIIAKDVKDVLYDLVISLMAAANEIVPESKMLLKKNIQSY